MSGRAVAPREQFPQQFPVACFWDIQNVPVSSADEPGDTSECIRSALQRLGFVGPLVSQMVFGDVTQLRARTRSALQTTGWSMVDVQADRKESADRALVLELLLFTRSVPPPAAILLISGDRDFAPVLHRIRGLGYSVLIAARTSKANVAPELVAAANDLIDFDHAMSRRKEVHWPAFQQSVSVALKENDEVAAAAAIRLAYKQGLRVRREQISLATLRRKRPDRKIPSASAAPRVLLHDAQSGEELYSRLLQQLAPLPMQPAHSKSGDYMLMPEAARPLPTAEELSPASRDADPKEALDRLLEAIPVDTPAWLHQACHTGGAVCDLLMLQLAVKRAQAEQLSPSALSAVQILHSSCSRSRSSAGALIAAIFEVVTPSQLQALVRSAQREILPPSRELAWAHEALASFTQPGWAKGGGGSEEFERRIELAISSESCEALRRAMLDSALRGNVQLERHRSFLRKCVNAHEAAPALRRAAALRDPELLRLRIAQVRKDFLTRGSTPKMFPKTGGELCVAIEAALAAAETVVEEVMVEATELAVARCKEDT